jgi:SagB-type dehydrogenase family enzyme
MVWKVLGARRIGVIVIVLALFGLASAYLLIWRATDSEVEPSPMENEVGIELPDPRLDGDVSVEEALLARRSIRKYTGEPLTLEDVSQLLWAAQGITDPRGFRTVPSAGALYPLEVYVVVGDVENLAEGVYKYKPHGHELMKVLDGDKRAELAKAALGQAWVKEAAINIVITAVYERTTVKYGDMGIRYVYMEVGHAAQNLCLQATAMDLGIVTVGAFYDEQVKEILNLPEKEKSLYIIPIGKK